MRKGKVVNIDEQACAGCGLCVSMCPKRILFINGSGKCDVVDEARCDRLGGCERACPVNAIKIS